MTATRLLGLLVEPFAQPLVQRAAVGVIVLGLIGGLIGPWTVLYGLSYAAESLAHSSLPGLVVASLVGLPLLLGAAGGLAAGAILVALAARRATVGRDTAVAIAVSSMLALGALLALAPRTPRALSELLFGDVLALSDADLALGVAVAGVLAVALVILHQRLLAVGFDREAARQLGVAPGPVDTALLLLLALAIVAVVPALGNLLAATLLIGPSAAAGRITRRMRPMFIISVALAIGCGLLGLDASYRLGTASGATISVTVILAYLGVLAATSRGRSTRPLAARRLADQPSGRRPGGVR